MEWQPRIEAGSRAGADALAWAVHDLAVAVADADVAISASLGVTTGDYLAIKHVLLHPDELGPVELSRLLGMSSGSATALVDRLEAAGHLVRRPHERDRRRRVLHLSIASERRVLDELESGAAEVDEIADAYTAGEREIVTSFIRALASRYRGRRDRSGP